MLREIPSLDERKRLLRALLQECPIVANFHDLMFTRSDEAWSKYRVFQYESGLAFCNAEGDWNIYAADPKVLQSLMEALWLKLGSRELKSIFGPDAFQFENQDRQPKDKDPYFLMSRSSVSSSLEIPEGFRIVEARQCPDAQALVNDWYRSYNEEEGRNWTPPKISELGEGRLFLFFNEANEFLGGVGNTLFSKDRFWIGRFYILPQFRRRGYAEAAMRLLLNLAAAEKKEFTLHVGGSNSRAQALYRKLGFRSHSPLAAWRFAS